MKKIAVAYKRFGGEPVAAWVSGEMACVTVDLLGRDCVIAEVPVLDAESYTHLGDLENADGGVGDGL